jgi:3-deoxy-D-arabino-heptulosonate 7-phosphate (DAHP) synthase class II
MHPSKRHKDREGRRLVAHLLAAETGGTATGLSRAGRLQEILSQLARLPPLVTSWEIETLKQQLAEATRGDRFLLQGAIARKVSPTANRVRSLTN